MLKLFGLPERDLVNKQRPWIATLWIKACYMMRVYCFTIASVWVPRFIMIKFPSRATDLCTVARCKMVLAFGYGELASISSKQNNIFSGNLRWKCGHFSQQKFEKGFVYEQFPQTHSLQIKQPLPPQGFPSSSPFQTRSLSRCRRAWRSRRTGTAATRSTTSRSTTGAWTADCTSPSPFGCTGHTLERKKLFFLFNLIQFLSYRLWFENFSIQFNSGCTASCSNWCPASSSQSSPHALCAPCTRWARWLLRRRK